MKIFIVSSNSLQLSSRALLIGLKLTTRLTQREDDAETLEFEQGIDSFTIHERLESFLKKSEERGSVVESTRAGKLTG